MGLTLAPLRSLASLFQSWLLALFGARVALDEAGGFEDRTSLRLHLGDGAGDGVADCVCLCGDAAALHMSVDFVVLCALRGRECFERYLRAFVSLKIVLQGLAVDHDARLRCRDHAHARDGGLAAPNCSDESGRSHIYEIMLLERPPRSTFAEQSFWRPAGE